MHDPAQQRKAHMFWRLHGTERGFVMPNAWDAGSAVLLASEGFEAIGTTSAGIAFSLAKPDYSMSGRDLLVTRAEMLDAVRRIVASVPIPVSADLESGYGDTPEAVADTIRLVIEAGAAGCNIEDVDRIGGGLLDEAAAIERIAAASAAAKSLGYTFALTARTDAFLSGHEDAVRIAIHRGNKFLEAGAQCIFVPGVADTERARLLAREIAGPVNLVVGLNENAANAFALIDAGIKRISVGGSIARAALGLLRRGARELRERGTISYAAGQIPQPELNALFEHARHQS